MYLTEGWKDKTKKKSKKIKFEMSDPEWLYSKDIYYEIKSIKCF